MTVICVRSTYDAGIRASVVYQADEVVVAGERIVGPENKTVLVVL